MYLLGAQRQLRSSLQQQLNAHQSSVNEVRCGGTPSKAQMTAMAQHTRDYELCRDRRQGTSQSNSSAVSVEPGHTTTTSTYNSHDANKQSTYEQLIQGIVRPPRSDVNWFANGSVKTFFQSDVKNRWRRINCIQFSILSIFHYSAVFHCSVLHFSCHVTH